MPLALGFLEFLKNKLLAKESFIDDSYSSSFSILVTYIFGVPVLESHLGVFEPDPLVK